MADNITLNSGSGGATLAADDVSSVWYQYVKLVDGTAESTTAVAIGGGAEANALRVTIANDSTGVVSVDDGGGNLSVDWAGTAPPIGAGVEATALRVTLATDSTGVVSVDDNGGALTVDNGGTFAVQVDGDALTALQLIDDAVFADDAAYTLGTSKGVMMMGFAGTQSVDANDAGAIAMETDGSIHIHDGGNIITVDGTVTANLSATDNAVLDSIQTAVELIDNAISGSEMQVDIVSGNVTNAGTFAVQVDGDALTALQLIDDAVFADDAAYTLGTSKGVMMMGFAGTQLVDANDAGAIAMETDGSIHIHDGGNTITVDGTVTANLSATDNAVLDSIQTAVEVIDNAISGSEMQVDIVSIAAQTNTLEVVGDVAHGAAAAGNPVALAARATNSVEGLTQVDAADASFVTSDLNGCLVTRPHTTLEEILSEHVTDTSGTSTNFTTFAAGGAGIHNYVTTIAVYNSSATDGYVDFRDGSAGSIIFTAPLPTLGGSIINLPVPLKGADNTALAYDVSGALSTVHISVVGFQAKG